MLAFYAYMIIGMDNDRFAQLGGSRPTTRPRYYEQLVAQGQNNPGWKAFEGNRNRYWMIDNLQDPQLVPFREGIYTLHRQGMDVMLHNPENARKSILDALRKHSEGITSRSQAQPLSVLSSMPRRMSW